MTNITVRDKKITIAGHSGYRENGSDIICASISTASQMLQNITQCEYSETQDSYTLHISSQDKNAKVFIELMKQLEEQYKEHVRVTR